MVPQALSPLPQRTRRAQDRVSVSQAPDRIRQAARLRRKERFTALFHHLGPEMLRTAFFGRDRRHTLRLQERETKAGAQKHLIASLHGDVEPLTSVSVQLPRPPLVGAVDASQESSFTTRE